MPSPVSTTISEIRSSNAEVPSELYTTDGDQAGSWMCDPSDGTVNVSWFGAIGDGITDDRDSIQKAIDATSEGGTLVLNSSKGFYIGDSLYVNKSITIQFQGSLITHVFNKPHIIIDQTDDVILTEEPVFLYVGPRPNISEEARPTSPDARLNVIFSNIIFTSDLSCGVLIYKRCDGFKILDGITISGKVIGVAMYTSMNDASQYSANTYIDSIVGDTLDFGFYAGGFINLFIGNITITNLTSSQGDPAHCIYIADRAEPNINLFVGTINLNGAKKITRARKNAASSDAFSVRATMNAFIGNVNIVGAQNKNKSTIYHPNLDKINANVNNAAEWQVGDIEGTILFAAASGNLIIKSSRTSVTARYPIRMSILTVSGIRIEISDPTYLTE